MVWEPGTGVVDLPGGGRVRGRGRRAGPPAPPDAEWTLALAGSPPKDLAGAVRWLRWRDFWVPSDPDDARDALEEARARARAGERVEVTCRGGRGRTGTAIACLARLDGVAAEHAVDWAREHYDRRAVETPWQRRFVARFPRA